MYNIVLFGGSGGDSYSGGVWVLGGRGGRTEATFILAVKTTLYFYIAAKGANTNDIPKEGGYNGGGKSNVYRGTGGGGSDFRTVKGDLYSRLLVAGGGGGGYNTGSQSNQGGSGGGLNGTAGGSDGTSAVGYYPCFGGQDGCLDGEQSLDAYFGQGTNYSFGGGGGGYWGGASANGCGSSGGSSFLGDYEIAYTQAGINLGDGYAIITYFTCDTCVVNIHNSYVCTVFYMLLLVTTKIVF